MSSSPNVPLRYILLQSYSKSIHIELMFLEQSSKRTYSFAVSHEVIGMKID